MKYQKLLYFLQNVGKNPSALIFEDELTGLNNRRYLFHYCQAEIDWKSIANHPACLLMINIDYFQQINNQYGHNTGDQVLIHAAATIKATAPANAVAVRYAGSTFLLLLPNREKAEARSIAEKLLHETRKQPFFMPEAGARIPLSLSIGMAAAPADASDIKNLIHKADMAMYAARKTGRDRCVDATEVSDSSVFPKTALQYLENAGLAGRSDQLSRIRESMQQFGRGKNRMIIVDGVPGIGKTRFLSSIEKDLEDHFQPIRVHGVIEEAFRPYYMAAYIAMALMNQLEDKGLSILEQADEAEVDRLAQVIPQIREGDPPLPENDPEQREAVFSSFIRFLTRLAVEGPLVLLIDNLHYCDPASLHLIRMLILSDHPVFLCGTASQEKQTIGESVALDLFRNAYSEELEIQTVSLTPLTESDIETHLNTIFSDIQLPKGLCREMARVTRGNPLFLTEIIRKMIHDGTIGKKEHKWTIPPLDKDYFPRSLEEIIRLKMNSLDEDSRRFLDQASAFGESSFLSMLAGITRDYSSRLYEIINNAEQQGIVQTEFESNDENIRFSSKQVRDIIYDGISPEEKKLLHQQIGIYQESLFQQNLLPSAAFLAHHFSRSDEIEKAGDYKKAQDIRNQNLFQEQEIPGWSDSVPKEEADEDGAGTGQGLGDAALSSQARHLVPHLLRALLVAVRNTRLYPTQSKPVNSAAKDLLQILERIFYTNDQISITVEGDDLWINGEKPPKAPAAGVEANMRELFSRMEIKSLLFRYGLGETELQCVLDELSQAGRKTIASGHWKFFMEHRQLRCVEVRQVAYTTVEKTYRAADGSENTTVRDPADSPPDPPSPDFQQSSDTRMQESHRIIGAFLGTYSKFRLYPAGGTVTRKAAGRLVSELQAVLSRQPLLILSRVKNSLLINGAKVDPTGFEALCKAMVRLMANTGIHSLTFTARITEKDLETFFHACFQISAQEGSAQFWQELMQTRKSSAFLINQRVYNEQQINPRGAVMESDDGQGRPGAEADSAAGAEAGPGVEALEQEPDPAPEALSDPMDEDLAARIRDLFLKGETERVKTILQQLAHLYDDSERIEKIKVLNRFFALLDPPGWQPVGAYLKLVLSALIPLFDAETHGPTVRQIADRLHQCAAALILYGDYPTAAWIFSRLQQHALLTAAGGLETYDRPRVFGRDLDPAIVDVLRADLKSADNRRRQQAGQVMSTLGTGAIPILIELITQEEDIRVRRLAARILGNLGQPGSEQLKKSLISRTRAEEKIRILEVLDAVTTEVATELRYTIVDSKESVRRSVFRLMQRIDRPETTSLLADLARSRDTEMAVEAVSHLGARKSAQAVGALLELSDQVDHPNVLAAVCRAMGQQASSRFLKPLEKILFPSRRFFRKSRYPAQVRIAAAYAVSRFTGEPARQMLRALKNDKDPRVREAAALLE